MRQSFFWYVFLLVFADQLAKHLVRNALSGGQSLVIIPNIFHITYVKNTGIGFGLMQNMVPVIIAGSVIIIISILYYYCYVPQEPLVLVSLTLIIGGSIGNLMDRVIDGYVTDFFDFRIWPVFNIADIAVTAGAIFFVYLMYNRKL